MHARAQTQGGTDLATLIAGLGLREGQVRLGDQYLIAAGFAGQGDLASWYGCLDVLSNCSYGEGFGLAALEAQACGTPVVVTDCSAMTELCGSGWLVEAVELVAPGVLRLVGPPLGPGHRRSVRGSVRAVAGRRAGPLPGEGQMLRPSIRR